MDTYTKKTKQFFGKSKPNIIDDYYVYFESNVDESIRYPLQLKSAVYPTNENILKNCASQLGRLRLATDSENDAAVLGLTIALLSVKEQFPWIKEYYNIKATTTTTTATSKTTGFDEFTKLIPTPSSGARNLSANEIPVITDGAYEPVVLQMIGDINDLIRPKRLLLVGETSVEKTLDDMGMVIKKKNVYKWTENVSIASLKEKGVLIAMPPQERIDNPFRFTTDIYYGLFGHGIPIIAFPYLTQPPNLTQALPLTIDIFMREDADGPIAPYISKVPVIYIRYQYVIDEGKHKITDQMSAIPYFNSLK